MIAQYGYGMNATIGRCACGKVPHSKLDAIQTCVRMRKEGHARVNAYRCPKLKGREDKWHVGHNRAKPKQRR